MAEIATKTISLKKTYPIKKMGTSGLREKQEVYNSHQFLEQFTGGIAAYFLELKKDYADKNTIIIGGDPREGNPVRIKKTACIMAAAGFRVLVADNGLASTPAMSHAIREKHALAGVILTASHNPFTDVGIKVNGPDGAPALDDAVNRIHELQNSTTEYTTLDFEDAIDHGLIEYIDIVNLYADLLNSIFDFRGMKKQLEQNPLKGVFDPMYGAAGPFAEEVFINRLGLNCEIIHSEPRSDLGGFDDKGEPLHPEPDFTYIPELISMNATGDYAIVSAWDSDADRRLDGGSGFFIESADEFALFAEYSHLINISSLFNDTVWFCRSTVTADTISMMQPALEKKYKGKKISTVETPTGFKWIAELGNWGVEESNGVGNPYLREKDGIFSTVFLLKIILETGKKPSELMEDIWKKYGRTYFTRGEVSGDDEKEKIKLTEIFNNAEACTGRQFGELTLENASSWNYIHPIEKTTAAKNAAWELKFSDGNTVKARFSGTGSGGYTLRVYCSKYDKRFNILKSKITEPMKKAFDLFLEENGFPKKSSHYTDENQPDFYAQ